jgi:hypothetical protein
MLAVATGGAWGSLLRRAFGLLLSGLFPGLAPGTRAASLIAGCVIGVALA